MPQSKFRAPVAGRTLTRAVFFGLGVASAAAAAASVSISGNPAKTVSAGSAYSFTPTASDSEGHEVRFWIANKPSWATFSTKTGTLSGTPASANVGTYSGIGIAGYSGNVNAIKWFNITVQPAGSGQAASAVKISGSPATSITAGSPYKFQPSASDAAARTLSFSISNKPSWMSFSIASGLLSGTPSAAQTGTYSNIIVSASDGVSSSSLAAFALKVSAANPATGSATVEWVDPTDNSNGSTLTNLAGVHLYYGTTAAALSNKVTITSTTQTSYTVGGLTAGTWYFAARAYNSSGTESGLSAIASKVIP